jgi:hypothetical protein
MIAGTVRNYESSVNLLQHVNEDRGIPEAEALREDVLVETVNTTVNGSKEPKEKR